MAPTMSRSSLMPPIWASISASRIMSPVRAPSVNELAKTSSVPLRCACNLHFTTSPPACFSKNSPRNYVSARLTEAVVESIAAENAARFAAMDSAHDNVAKKLAQLHRSAHLARQDEITTELLDLMTGAEAQASE
jgi:F0F1-type ATP synthase gamma subunit